MDEAVPISVWINFLLIVLALVVAPFALFRMLRAKTRAEYLNSVALFLIPAVTCLAFAYLSGLIPPLEINEEQTETEVEQVFERMPMPQKILLGGGLSVWLVGMSTAFYSLRKRLGKRWWEWLSPLDPPYKDFNRREWFLFIAGFIVWAVMGGLAVFVSW